MRLKAELPGARKLGAHLPEDLIAVWFVGGFSGESQLWEQGRQSKRRESQSYICFHE